MTMKRKYLPLGEASQYNVMEVGGWKALLVSDFGPKTAIKIVESLRKDILAGNLKSGQEIKSALKRKVLGLLTEKVQKTELQLGLKRPAVIMVVGVNGGGKTTSLGD
eukprot:Gb_23519 [translate_table: standard]